MPITINGSGTIGGVSVGGLPDGTVDTDMLAANAVTEAKLGSDEASGLCKAWVSVNGQGTAVINGSYNIASLTDGGVGDFRLDFTTPMPDTDYVVLHGNGESGAYIYNVGASARLTTSCDLRIFVSTSAAANDGSTANCFAIFR